MVRRYSKAHREQLRVARIRANKQIVNCHYCQRIVSALNIKRHEKSCKKNPNREPSSYIDICFKYHIRKCVICSEFRCVEVHHLDRNRENNHPTNLVPLCPNHHRYAHNAKYKYLVEDKIFEYVRKFEQELISANNS